MVGVKLTDFKEEMKKQIEKNEEDKYNKVAEKNVDVMNIENITHHYHEIEGLLTHTHKYEKETGYYVLISFDKNDNEIERSTFLNFTKEYKEHYQT